MQRRVTATFQQRDGGTMHVRKATVAEPALRRIYDTLGHRCVAGRGPETDRLNLNDALVVPLEPAEAV